MPGDAAIALHRKPLNRACQRCGKRGTIFKLNQRFCGAQCQREDYNERKREGRKCEEFCPTCKQAIRRPRGRPRKDGAVKRKARS